MKNSPTDMRPSSATAVSAAAATNVERFDGTTRGTRPISAGRARMKRTVPPSVATSDAWLDVHEEGPADVVEHDEVDIRGVNATTAPVTAAVANVKSRQFSAAMSVTTPTAAPPFRQRPHERETRRSGESHRTGHRRARAHRLAGCLLR